MPKTGLKKTLNLHKYSIRVNNIFLNKKIITPTIFALLGLAAGCIYSKGDGAFYLKLTSWFSETVLNESLTALLPFALRLLLPPTLAVGLAFFFGLSAFGGFISNLLPSSYAFIVGIISCYMYKTYTLKGLAYCVIMLFPYAVLTLTSIIICTSESISMSEVILRCISRSNKFTDYSFSKYYKSLFKGYIYTIIAVGVKLVIDYLFGGLFAF